MLLETLNSIEQSLTSFQKLNLDENEIEGVSVEQMSNLSPNLLHLSLKHNQITRLPDNIGAYFTGLRSLILSQNMLKEIPLSVTMLEDLEKLYINGNSFQRIPLKLHLLTNLRQFNLDWFYYLDGGLSESGYIVSSTQLDSFFAKLKEIASSMP